VNPKGNFLSCFPLRKSSNGDVDVAAGWNVDVDIGRSCRWCNGSLFDDGEDDSTTEALGNRLSTSSHSSFDDNSAAADEADFG
jgi:hypothetical protein